MLWTSREPPGRTARGGFPILGVRGLSGGVVILLAMLFLFLACTSPASTLETGDDTSESEEILLPDCDNLAALPVEATRISGFTTSEDFAFDIEGHFVSPDANGNVLKITMDGDFEVLSPNFGEAAGMAYLPDGDLVVASPWRGNLEVISPDGGRTTLLSGLSYPNGVTVDAAGFIYVAEHDAGAVRVLERRENTLDDASSLGDGQRAVGDDVLEQAALDVLHDDDRNHRLAHARLRHDLFARVEYAHDRGVGHA